MNKKGFTIIELLSSFALSSIIVALLFETVMIVRILYKEAGIRMQLLNKQALISEKINDDFNNKTISSIEKIDDTTVSIIFTDATSKDIYFDRNDLVFQYGDYKTNLVAGSYFGDISITVDKTVNNLDGEYYDSILKVSIPVHHDLFKQQDYGINVMYLFEDGDISIGNNFSDGIEDNLVNERSIRLRGSSDDIAFKGINYNDPGYLTIDKEGDEISNSTHVIVDGEVGNESGETYTLTYKIVDSNDNVIDSVTRNVTVIDTVTTFTYTGQMDTFTVPISGNYKLEVWGAQGGSVGDYSTGGKGGYTAGEIELTKDTILNIYVGGAGSFAINSSVAGCFNGGGTSGAGNESSGGSGGGASDIRMNGNNLANRIIIAGGGGGAGSRNDSSSPSSGGAGGGEVGLVGTYSTASYNGSAGTSTLGGNAASYSTDVTLEPTAGTLGLGGNGGSYNSSYGGGGGGAGYYGGGGGVRYGTGAGGSGYCGSLLRCTSYNGTQSFSAPDGLNSEIGHEGNGTIKITLMSIITSY